jgi:hypothetical protein
MTCPKCKTEVVRLTKDHITPKWFLKIAWNLKTITRKEWVIMQKEMGISNMQMICSDCNNIRKGGKLDMTNPLTRIMVEKVATHLTSLLNAKTKKSVPVKSSPTLSRLLGMLDLSFKRTDKGRTGNTSYNRQGQ